MEIGNHFLWLQIGVIRAKKSFHRVDAIIVIYKQGSIGTMELRHGQKHSAIPLEQAKLPYT